MNALKSVVILMGVAIAVLMTLTIYGLYQKTQDADFKFFDLGGKDKAATATMPNAPVSGALETEVVATAAFGDVSLNLPQGARIVSATASGARLIVIVATGGDNADQVWVVDMGTGQVLGRIKTGQ